MYVSSFTTHIDTNAVNKTHNRRQSDDKKSSQSFEVLSAKTPNKAPSLAKNQLPIDYVSNYKALNNKQLLEEQSAFKDAAKTKFTQLNSLSNAHSAYKDNTSIFSFLVKPKATLDQTPRLDRRLPPEAAKTQKNALASLMVNTYIANENYYKVTA